MSAYQGGRSVELVTSDADWQRVWHLVGGGRPAPEVNFNTQAALVVFQGRQPTGGYSVEVAGVRRTSTEIAVRINERRPASGDITTQVVTSPFVAVSIPRPPAGSTVRLDAGEEPAAEQKPTNRQEIVTPRGQRQRRRTRRGP